MYTVMKEHDQTDASLLSEFAVSHSETCFEEIVNRNGPLVLGVCRRVLGNSHDAEDAAQAVFLALAMKATTLSARGSLRCWLHQVAWNVSRRVRDARKSRTGHEQEAAMAQRNDVTEQHGAMLRPVLDEELDRLPEIFRLPLILHHLEGRTKEETAALLNENAGTIAARLDRGREKLRARLMRRGITLESSALAVAITQAPVALPTGFAALSAHAAALTATGKIAGAAATVQASAKLAHATLAGTHASFVKAVVVVALIICVGTGAAAYPLIGRYRTQAKETATRGLIKSLETAIAAYEFDWGVFPPDGYAALPGPPQLPVYGYTSSGAKYSIRSSSALYYYLTTAFRQTPNVENGEVWGSKDVGPYLVVPEPNQKASSFDALGTDIIDVFGRPLVYDNIRDPQTSATGFDPAPAGPYTIEIRNDPILVAPDPKHPGNSARNLQGVDIYSLGVGTGTQCTRPIANFRCIWEQR